MHFIQTETTRAAGYRFVAGHENCALSRHLDSVPPETPIRDIVQCRRAMQTRGPENCETGAGEGSAGIHGERTSVRAG